MTPPARTQRRSMAPWLVFVMSFGIAFGIGNDHKLRAELMTELRGVSAPAASAVEAGCHAVQRVLAAERAAAPRPMTGPTSR